MVLKQKTDDRPYGAWELKTAYQRNIVISNLIIVLLVLSVIMVLPDKKQPRSDFFCPIIIKGPPQIQTIDSPLLNSIMIMPEANRRELIIDGYIGLDRVRKIYQRTI